VCENQHFRQIRSLLSDQGLTFGVSYHRNSHEKRAIGYARFPPITDDLESERSSTAQVRPFSGCCSRHLSFHPMHPMHRSGADAQRFGRFEDTRTRHQFRPNTLNDIGAHRATPEPFSLCSGTGKAQIDPGRE
jgi:hypothetical protein